MWPTRAVEQRCLHAAVMGRVDCVFANAGFNSRARPSPTSPARCITSCSTSICTALFTPCARPRSICAHAPRLAIRRLDRALRQSVHLSRYPGHGALRSRQRRTRRDDQGTRGGTGPVWRARQHDRAGLLRQRLQTYESAERSDYQAFSAITPLGRPGYIHDIEGPAAYLASDASIFQTGDILVLDGGRMVKSLDLNLQR